jgi:hypothetical protein
MFDQRRIRKHGIFAEATVKSMVASHSSQDMARNYDYVLEVRPVDGAPFEATLRHSAAFLAGKPQEYDVVKVKYDPKSLKVIFDFTGDPRFDVQAMNAHTAQLRKETAEMLAARQQPNSSYPALSEAQSGSLGAFANLSNLANLSIAAMTRIPAGSATPIVINASNDHGNSVRSGNFSDSAGPDAQAAKLIGLAQMVEAGLLTREQFEELKLRILSANE